MKIRYAMNVLFFLCMHSVFYLITPLLLKYFWLKYAASHYLQGNRRIFLLCGSNNNSNGSVYFYFITFFTSTLF